MSLPKDEFRRTQRESCPDGGSHAGCHGCPCCRAISDLNKHKKVTRKIARHKLKEKDNTLFKNECVDDTEYSKL